MEPEKRDEVRERIVIWSIVAVVVIAVITGMIINKVQHDRTVNCFATGQDC